ncbi:PQQ-dependent sugar dehydrogenase [Candidatus Poriferisocius sp.]|uniref:PQQ-dependent sugar dehydrogenase n=1 Tax=Candidatus Poriferisocius sp. TaxID=3101276 RepID=UPI003B0228FA
MSICCRAVAVLAAAFLLASACGSGNDDVAQRDDGPASMPTAAATAGAAATTAPAQQSGADAPTVAGDQPAGSPATGSASDQGEDAPTAVADQPEESNLVLTPVASLTDPMALVARPGTGGTSGDLYVGTREGQVWLMSADGDEPPEMVLDISAQTNPECEEGLLGIAFSPDGSLLYVSSTDLRGDSLIVEYPMSGQWVQGDQGRTVLSVDQPACNHNGGHIAFGPDGYLWIGFGDGGGRDDMFNQGQNLNTLLATMLRIDPEANGNSAYSIPTDNPFADGGGRAEIWHYGARNPWRFSFDRTTDDLWIADVGQNEWEEIHVLRAADGWAPGANLGWPLFEGNVRFSGTETPEDLDFPIHVYDHDTGCSITGGHVYRGSAIPSLVGTYVFGDFCQGRLWGLTTDGQGVVTREELNLSVPGGTLVSFGEDAAGELYVLSFDDTVYRLELAR